MSLPQFCRTMKHFDNQALKRLHKIKITNFPPKLHHFGNHFKSSYEFHNRRFIGLKYHRCDQFGFWRIDYFWNLRGFTVRQPLSHTHCESPSCVLVGVRMCVPLCVRNLTEDVSGRF